MRYESHALMVHAEYKKTLYGEDLSGVTVVKHAVKNSTTGLQLGAGQAFDNSSKARLVKLLGDDLEKTKAEESSWIKRCQFLPKNLIALSADRIIWQKPRCRLNICFDRNDYKYIDVPSPTLIFCLDRKSGLSVFAIKGAKARKNSILYNAPFGNINGNGAMCTGNQGLLRFSDSIEETIRSCETMFSQSAFTECHGNPVRGVRTFDKLVDHWKTISKSAVFDNSLLIRSSRSEKHLGEIINAWS